ncbi:MAG: helix-turn-helix transcriptional regulator [Actinobacteria bacterium]|jgi:transcriptional regulator with XRE-family HTH domain|nr:helix-turn-helix transcriptional regulator [Actinomycetota bacterium]
MKKSIYSKEYEYLVSQLKKARLEAGLTQVKVSKLLKKSQSNISKVEKGQIRLDVIQLRVYAKLYKKDLNYFLR